MIRPSVTKKRRVVRPVTISFFAGLVACAMTLGIGWAAQAEESVQMPSESPGGAAGLETFKLADRNNFRRLTNGDFLFRLARETRTGVVYWAYMGTTEHVVATVPDPRLLADDEAARRILLRIADLPTRVGCGVGLIHRSKVYVVPEDAVYGESDYVPNVSPLFVLGEVRNDASGKTPTTLLSYRNFVAEQDLP